MSLLLRDLLRPAGARQLFLFDGPGSHRVVQHMIALSLTGQNLKFDDAFQIGGPTNQLLQGNLHIRGLRRYRHCRTAVGWDRLIDRQYIRSASGKNS